MFRKVHEVVMRLHVAVHPNTLAIAANLIWLCPSQGKANTPMPRGSSALLGTKHERLPVVSATTLASSVVITTTTFSLCSSCFRLAAA